jgi:hypothetical protein
MLILRPARVKRSRLRFFGKRASRSAPAAWHDKLGRMRAGVAGPAAFEVADSSNRRIVAPCRVRRSWRARTWRTSEASIR